MENEALSVSGLNRANSAKATPTKQSVKLINARTLKNPAWRLFLPGLTDLAQEMMQVWARGDRLLFFFIRVNVEFCGAMLSGN